MRKSTASLVSQACSLDAALRCRGLQALGDVDVLGHPTRYGQVVPYQLLDRWVVLQETN